MVKNGKLSGIQKIAVVRANALGDFIFTLPALEALRMTYPEAEIILLAKAWHAAFLTGRTSPIERAIIIPPYRGVSTEPEAEEQVEELEHFFACMKRENFDLALQLHGGGHYSNPFVQQLGARVTVGLKTPEAVALDRWKPYLYLQSEIARYLEVMSLIGVEPVTLDPHITVMPQDIAESSQLVADTSKAFVVLHPGASDPRRRWSAAKFAQVGNALLGVGAHVIVTGTEDERAIVEEVVAGTDHRAQSVCGSLSLNGLTGLLSRCQLVISNDTGPLHLACAVGIPTVGIYWAYNILTAGTLTRNYLRPIITWRMTCPVCNSDNSMQRCEHTISFVDDIAAEEVIANALELYTPK